MLTSAHKKVLASTNVAFRFDQFLDEFEKEHKRMKTKVSSWELSAITKIRNIINHTEDEVILVKRIQNIVDNISSMNEFLYSIGWYTHDMSLKTYINIVIDDLDKEKIISHLQKQNNELQNSKIEAVNEANKIIQAIKKQHAEKIASLDGKFTKQQSLWAETIAGQNKEISLLKSQLKKLEDQHFSGSKNREDELLNQNMILLGTISALQSQLHDKLLEQPKIVEDDVKTNSFTLEKSMVAKI